MIWEKIIFNNEGLVITWRLEVFKGWILRYSGTNTMVFVPDPNHEWKL